MTLTFAIIVLLALVLWTMCHLPTETNLGYTDSEKAKLRENLILDIRSANQYCIAIIALAGVIAVILANNSSDLKPVLESLKLWPFGLGFTAATISIVFIPAGYGSGSFTTLRLIWARTILCEQTAVVSICYGIWEAFVILA